MRITRLAIIVVIALKYGLDEFLTGHERFRAVRPAARALTFWRDTSAPRGQRLRLALEDLGPIFVKFGQMLSTRRDLLPADIADELAKLQDRVPPFATEQVLNAHAAVRQARRRGFPVVRPDADRERIGRAGAFRRAARRHAGRGQGAAAEHREGDREGHVAAAGRRAALEKLWSDGKRLRPRDVVAEFERTLRDELDLSREAANCSQLRRNFQHSPLLLVPEVHWDYCGTDVMVMERMTGIPIAQVDRLREAGIDIPRLARAGVELFFTQVFRDAYFHADMHPGNIFVATEAPHHGKYIAVDFGIMGTLSERDQGYLAQNFLAFFRRDYHRVATAHLESGWVPPDTRVDELEAEIRVVLEPAFDRPLSEISLGRVLLQLFRASRRFNVEIQPQLVLLQKTLLNVEGLGRQLDPNLDLWVTALPYLERWMNDRIGLPALKRRLLAEAPYIAAALPELPRLIHQRLMAPVGRGRSAQGARRGAARATPAGVIAMLLAESRPAALR